jgi:hypothetical protein
VARLTKGLAARFHAHRLRCVTENADIYLPRVINDVPANGEIVTCGHLDTPQGRELMNVASKVGVDTTRCAMCLPPEGRLDHPLAVSGMKPFELLLRPNSSDHQVFLQVRLPPKKFLVP